MTFTVDWVLAILVSHASFPPPTLFRLRAACGLRTMSLCFDWSSVALLDYDLRGWQGVACQLWQVWLSHDWLSIRDQISNPFPPRSHLVWSVKYVVCYSEVCAKSFDRELYFFLYILNRLCTDIRFATTRSSNSKQTLFFFLLTFGFIWLALELFNACCPAVIHAIPNRPPHHMIASLSVSMKTLGTLTTCMFL